MSTTEQKKKGGPKKTTANPAKEIKEPINQELTGSPEVKEPEMIKISIPVNKNKKWDYAYPVRKIYVATAFHRIIKII